MLSQAGSDGVKAVFDIDHGFEFGDSIVWASWLRLHKGVFNNNGALTGSTQVIAGPGIVNPTVGGGGSTSWIDDYLTVQLTQPGTYFLEVGKWYPFNAGGLPDGVDYELQVSLETHEVH